MVKIIQNAETDCGRAGEGDGLEGKTLLSAGIDAVQCRGSSDCHQQSDPKLDSGVHNEHEQQDANKNNDNTNDHKNVVYPRALGGACHVDYLPVELTCAGLDLR